MTEPKEIAILGTSPLALFMAARFTLAGYHPIIITAPAQAESLAQTDYMLKEERALVHHKFRFTTTYQLERRPDLLIIAAGSESIRAHLPLLSPALLSGVTAVDTCGFGDRSFIAPFLKNPPVNAYFNGFVSQDKNQLTTHTKQNDFAIALTENERRYIELDSLFSTAGFTLIPNPDEADNFWRAFIPYAAGSLLAGMRGKNIYLLTKDERERRLLDQIITELTSLSAADNTPLFPGDLLAAVYATPSAYAYPIQTADSRLINAQLTMLSNTILGAAEKSLVPIPGLRKLLADFYKKLC